MPELPEVETIANQIAPWVVGKEVLEAWSFHPKFNLDFMAGAKVLSLSRRAKYLVFQTTKGKGIIHLGMSGRISIQNLPERKKHDHLLLKFRDNIFLILNDPRRFGRANFVDDNFANDIGPEPLAPEFTPQVLYDIMKKNHRTLKEALLDSKIIAGLGNIYVNEVLFLAGINPWSRCLTQEKSELTCLIIKEVLTKAITNKGSTLKDYKDISGKSGNFQNLWQVYQKDGKICNLCGGTILKKNQNGRPTFWCPDHQILDL